jgi:hypothetical protein
MRAVSLVYLPLGPPIDPELSTDLLKHGEADPELRGGVRDAHVEVRLDLLQSQYLHGRLLRVLQLVALLEHGLVQEAKGTEVFKQRKWLSSLQKEKKLFGSFALPWSTRVSPPSQRNGICLCKRNGSALLETAVVFTEGMEMIFEGTEVGFAKGTQVVLLKEQKQFLKEQKSFFKDKWI